MKKVIRLTESDLHGIIRKSVNKILREADINSDTEGLRDSLMQYIKNPVDIVKDVDYEPSDDEIVGALDDLDLDTDFSDLMGGQYDESRRMRGHRLTEGRLRRIVKESIKKVLSEMPVGKKINFNVDKRPVYKKFSTRARNPKFGLDKSSQRQMGMMYAQAMSEDRDDLAEKIWDYAHQKQEEASRINDEMYDILNNAFFQGEREFSNEDIWYDDDPQFN